MSLRERYARFENIVLSSDDEDDVRAQKLPSYTKPETHVSKHYIGGYDTTLPPAASTPACITTSPAPSSLPSSESLGSKNITQPASDSSSGQQVSFPSAVADALLRASPGALAGRAAIVCTMKDVLDRIDSWVRWHVWVGFERLYLFFDDARETAAMAAAEQAGGSAVVAWYHGACLSAAWALQSSWPSMASKAERDVQVRQILNTQVAMGRAREEGIGWVLSIDSDELFMPQAVAPSPAPSPSPSLPSSPSPSFPPSCSPSPADASALSLRGAARALFARLSAEGVETFSFVNHEAVPETAHGDAGDAERARTQHGSPRGSKGCAGQSGGGQSGGGCSGYDGVDGEWGRDGRRTDQSGVHDRSTAGGSLVGGGGVERGTGILDAELGQDEYSARGDPFDSLTLFKRSLAAVAAATEAATASTAAAAAVVAAAVDSWRARNASGSYFLYYEHGKSAVRVDTDGLWVPPTVHYFFPRKPDGTWDEARLRQRGRTNDHRNVMFRLSACEASCVLHYPLWDARALWAKYVLHGDFPDVIVGGTLRGREWEWGECFHTQCRDLLRQRRADDDGGLGAMRHLFASAAAAPDQKQAEQQLRAGVLVRVGAVQRVLRQSRDEARAAMATVQTNGEGATQFTAKTGATSKESATSTLVHTAAVADDVSVVLGTFPCKDAEYACDGQCGHGDDDSIRGGDNSSARSSISGESDCLLLELNLPESLGQLNMPGAEGQNGSGGIRCGGANGSSDNNSSGGGVLQAFGDDDNFDDNLPWLELNEPDCNAHEPHDDFDEPVLESNAEPF
uniref:Glycosyltransferase family 92 protein n=1 Tax=Chrysotila carterae TaxID=13221 RepID=A0A7S4BNC3_CHRCT